MAVELKDPIRVWAYIGSSRNRDHEIRDIYELEGNRENFKTWYGEIRALNPGCKFAIRRPDDLAPLN